MRTHALQSTNTHTVSVFYLILIRYDKKLQCSFNRMLVFKFFAFCLAHQTMANTSRTRNKGGEAKWRQLKCGLLLLRRAESEIFQRSLDWWPLNRLCVRYEWNINSAIKIPKTKAIKSTEPSSECCVHDIAHIAFGVETNYCEFIKCDLSIWLWCARARPMIDVNS